METYKKFLYQRMSKGRRNKISKAKIPSSQNIKYSFETILNNVFFYKVSLD